MHWAQPWMVQLFLNALLSPEHRASHISSMFSVSQLLSSHSSGFSQERAGSIQLAATSWKLVTLVSLLKVADFPDGCVKVDRYIYFSFFLYSCAFPLLFMRPLHTSHNEVWKFIGHLFVHMNCQTKYSFHNIFWEAAVANHNHYQHVMFPKLSHILQEKNSPDQEVNQEP